MKIFALTPLSMLCALSLTACGGGSSSGGGSSTGQLSLAITDAPVDEADAVVVAFDSVEFQGPERTTLELDETATINLLDFQNGESFTLVDAETLPAGEYQFIRLGINEDDTYIEVAGEQFPLTVPSGSQSGLQLNRGFTLAAGGVSQFTIDFDLRKSITMQGNGSYRLRPTLRIVDNLEVGSIAGTVSDSLITDVNCNNGDNNDIGNVVYLYSGLDASVIDVQDLETDPLASTNATFNSETSAYEFTLAFVEAGDYTLAFTCDAVLDDPEVDDSETVVFTEGMNVTVESEQQATVTF